MIPKRNYVRIMQKGEKNEQEVEKCFNKLTEAT